jgi:hypothetical protein
VRRRSVRAVQVVPQQGLPGFARGWLCAGSAGNLTTVAARRPLCNRACRATARWPSLRERERSNLHHHPRTPYGLCALPPARTTQKPKNQKGINDIHPAGPVTRSGALPTASGSGLRLTGRASRQCLRPGGNRGPKPPGTSRRPVNVTPMRSPAAADDTVGSRAGRTERGLAINRLPARARAGRVAGGSFVESGSGILHVIATPCFVASRSD